MAPACLCPSPCHSQGLGDVPVAPHEVSAKQEGILPKIELMPIKTDTTPTRHLVWLQPHAQPTCPLCTWEQGTALSTGLRPQGLSHLVRPPGEELAHITHRELAKLQSGPQLLGSAPPTLALCFCHLASGRAGPTSFPWKRPRLEPVHLCHCRRWTSSLQVSRREMGSAVRSVHPAPESALTNTEREGW